MTINERIAELEAKQEVITKEIAELKEEDRRMETKGISLFSDHKPEMSYCYYVPSGEISAAYVSEKDLMSVFNIFPTMYADKVKDFYNHVIKINNLLMQYKLALCPDYEPDWGNDYVYYVKYNYIAECWGIRGVCSDFHCVCFDMESAQKVAEDLNRRGVKP